MNEKRSYIYVSLAVFLWASVAAVGKLILRDLDNLQVVFYTSLFSSISLFVIVLFQRKLYLVKKYKLIDYWRFAYMGFVGVFLYYVFFFSSLMFAPAQEVFIINYTWPIWVVIFATLILKEKFSFKEFIAILLSFIGVYIVATKGNLIDFTVISIKGDLLALAAAIFYSIFSIMGKKFNYDKIVSMMFYYIFTFFFIAAWTVTFSEISGVTLFELAGLLWIGIFCSGTASVFWFLALKYGDTAKVSNIVFLTPFLSLVYIYFLLGEKILISSIVGLVLIVFGIMIQASGGKSDLK